MVMSYPELFWKLTVSPGWTMTPGWLGVNVLSIVIACVNACGSGRLRAAAMAGSFSIDFSYFPLGRKLDPRASLADPEHFSGPQGHNLFAGFSRYTATPERDRPGLRMLRRWSPAHSGRRAKARALIVCAVEPFREAFSWSRAAPGWPARWRRAGCLEPSVQARRSHHHAPARLCPSL